MTLGDIIRKNATKFPDDLALVFKDNRFTFAQYDQRTSTLANALIDFLEPRRETGFVSS